MNQKQQFNLKRSITKFVFLLFFSFLAPLFVLAQEAIKPMKLTNLDRVRNLKLDSIQTSFTAYYSKGYATRAIEMSKRIANDRSFYQDSLMIDVKVILALLDPADNAKAPIAGPPYGMPFVGDDDHMIVMPADTSTGAVKEAYSPFKKTVSANAVKKLKQAGFTYDDALNTMVDLVALHEIGHTQVSAYGIRTRQPWFAEFMATYVGYAYMHYREPKMATVWDITTHAGYVGYKPKYKTLDVFNKLYIKVGSDNYVWYQNAFSERIRDVFSKKGLSFIRLVREKLADKTFKPATAQELLIVLEKIEPGFIKWADSLNNVE